jgi:hypothetical protein
MCPNVNYCSRNWKNLQDFMVTLFKSVVTLDNYMVTFNDSMESISYSLASFCDSNVISYNSWICLFEFRVNLNDS